MSLIYISCIRRDLEVAEYLSYRLTKLGYRIRDVEPLFLEKQINSINQADACILIWSPDSIKDAEMRELANQPLPKLLPIKLGATLSTDVPQNTQSPCLVVSFNETDKILTQLNNWRIRRNPIIPWGLLGWALAVLFIYLYFFADPSRYGGVGDNDGGWKIAIRDEAVRPNGNAN